jgi:cysteine-rich repeat protein
VSRFPLRAGVALVIALAAAPAARADRLFTRVAPGSTPGAARLARGIARVQSLAVSRSALGDLRRRGTADVGGFPLGVERDVTLHLERFEPFTPLARAEVVDWGGVRTLALPDDVYFRGTVAGDPGSRALVVAGPTEVQGFVITGGSVYPFGPDGAGGHRAYAMRDVDPTVYPPPRDFCGTDLYPEAVHAPAVLADAIGASPAIAPTSSIVEADVALDSDNEFRSKFGSDQAALAYLANLIAAANVIYERDVQVHLRYSYIRLWNATDPWSAPPDQLDTMLYEVQDYWNAPANNMNAIAGPRDLVQFVSGKTVYGGIAYISAVCNTGLAYAMTEVFATSSSPPQMWDVLVTTHEIGHIMGTDHTHCYVPPIDVCASENRGTCYHAATASSQGTIMSYCHLWPGGLANIDMVFGSRVVATIDAEVASVSCLSPYNPTPAVCGNGAIESGEECDDGNLVDGDGCSSTCQREPKCGDGFVDAPEQCDDGNLIDGDGCSSTCQSEPQCGDGRVDAGEECDDGNDESDDGCSATCRLEDCLILSQLQRVWELSNLTLKRRGGGDRLSLTARFGVPMRVATLSPAAHGTRFVIQSASDVPRLDVVLPAAAWKGGRRHWTYRDRSGAAGGIRKLVVRDRTSGGVPDVQVEVSGRGSYPVVPGDLPIKVMLIFGDAAAGRAGACARHPFGPADCGAFAGGSRFVCR